MLPRKCPQVWATAKKEGKTYLPMGHTIKIDGLGVFSLSLKFTDEMDENEETSPQHEASKTKKKYHHVKVKGLNFKVDKKLVAAINSESTFEYSGVNAALRSPYSFEERAQRALTHIEKHGFITLQDYANLNHLSRSTASRELKKLDSDPTSSIQANGASSHKIWVKK